MIVKSLLLSFVLLVGVSACTQPAFPLTNHQVLGVLELSFDAGSGRTQTNFRPRAGLSDSAASFTNPINIYATDANTGTRYLKANFTVTNNTLGGFNNLTLYAFNQASANSGGSAIKNLVNFGNGNVNTAQAAQSLRPTHGMSLNGGVPGISASEEDLQVFLPGETAAIKTEAQALGMLTAGDTVLEYGYVARNLANTRAIPGGGTGRITVAFKLPDTVLTDTAQPYRFVGTFVLSNETNTRVSRSPEETTANAEARATALGASEVVLVGQDTDISGVGTTLRRVNALIGTSPTFLRDEVAILAAATTTRLSAPSGGPAFLSGVISDPTDPASTQGIDFSLTGNNLSLSASSSNQAVVSNANLNLSGAGSSRNLKITPSGIGYTTITLTASNTSSNASYIINYAVSAASGQPATTRFFTGAADASASVAVDANYMLIADDENQALRLYDRANSGLPVSQFDVTANLQLTDIAGGVPREVDIEGATRVGNRIYWLGSHSNASNGNLRPNRYRLFATDLSGSGSSTTLGYVGRYDNLRTDLINWDTSNSHGKGSNYYGLSVSAATGIAPERDDGFNIEGFSLAPSGVAPNTVYIGFRAPIVPTNLRSKALIVPVTNFASLVSGNPSLGPASFGAPIELDLGGRGIRSLECNDQGCLIVGGATAGGGNFRLFTWSGNPANAPVLRDADLTALNSDGSFEGIVELPTGAIGTWAAQQVQLAVDNGDTVYYNDAVAAKDLPQANFKKARTERINVGAAVNAPFVSLAISPSSGTETAQTSLTITASAASAVSGNQTVTLGLSGAGVTNADFSAFSSTVTILSGQTSGSVSFNVADDALVEGAEVATFAITGTSAGLIAGAPSSVNLTITDNDLNCSSTTLNPGDLAIIGYITNGNPDSFSLVNLVPICNGTVIYFTDNGWTGTGFRGVTANLATGNEGLTRFIANADIPGGSVIRSTDTSPNFTWTTSGAIGAGGNYVSLGLGNSGEQIAAVQSTNPSNPLFTGFTALYQIDNTGVFENASNGSTGNLISGLSQAANTANLLNNTVNTSAVFNLTTLASGTRAQWLAAVNNPTNWTFGALTTLPTGTITLNP